MPPGGVVSPPAPGGGTPSGPQGGGGPGETVLPNTGARGDLLGLGVLGLILLSAGLVLGRPRRLTDR
jgi:LPXTG-motif cell wall-anchored protein